MKYLLTSLLIIGIQLMALGQPMEQRVRALFEQGTTLSWLNHFKGRMNDVNDVAITLASDGKKCKGYLWFLRSKAAFRVEGTIQDTVLNLTEYDSSGVVTGSILGSIKNFDGISADWFNYDKSLGEHIELLPTSKEPRYPGYCGDNKWIHRYEGIIRNEAVEMILRRGNNGQLQGVIYFAKDKLSYDIDGELSNYGRNIRLNIKDLNWNDKGKIIASIDFSDKIKGEFISPRGTASSCDFNPQIKLPVGCMEYADFMTKTEVSYPKTRNQQFNDKIRRRVEGWLASARAYTTQYAEQIPIKTPFYRSRMRSYCWYEIYYLSEQLISGMVTMTNTWTKEYENFTFNFNFSDNTALSQSRLFQENLDYSTFIQDYIKKEIQNRPFYNDSEFLNWIQNEKFSYFTIRKEGLDFSTGFNSIYGTQHVIIPYAALKPYLKENSPISHLVK